MQTWLGLEPIVGNFKKLHPTMDWRATADQIERPTRSALCHTLDGQGQVVISNGKPFVSLEEIPFAVDRDEFLAKKSKRFYKWWME